jgi:hypothetical protein
VLVLRVSQVVKFIFVFLDIHVFFPGIVYRENTKKVFKPTQLGFSPHKYTLFTRQKRETYLKLNPMKATFIDIKKVLPKK